MISQQLQVSKAVGNLGRAMKWVALKQKGSTIVSMVVLPEDGGGLAMKFRAMCDQGECF